MFTRHSHKLTTLLLILCAVAAGSLTTLAQDPNDIRPGSVLFFNRYTSSAANPAAEDTQINLTNTHPTQTINVHIFMVDSSSCSVADSFVTLTGSQTAYFLASDFDPGVRGYIIAVASDGGLPTQHNYLLGTAYLREADGRLADIPAVTVNKVQPGPIDQGVDATASMVFNGANTANSYDKLPGTVAISTFNSQVTDSTIFALYSPASNLLTGSSSGTSIFAIMYNDVEASRSLTFNIGCYSTLTLRQLRVLTGLDNFIPIGRTGWMKMSSSSRPLLGIVHNKGPLFNGGRNLSTVTLFNSYSITVPVF